MFIKRLLIISTLSILISACTSMSFKAMYEMATFDPLSIQPDELVLALRANESVIITKGSVEIKLAYSVPAYGEYAAVDRKHTFLVDVDRIAQTKKTEASDLLPEILLDGIEVNEQVTILRLNQQDAKEMMETQKLIKRYRDLDVKGKGMFSFSLNQSCIINSENLDSLFVDLFLKTSNEESFFVFFDDLDVVAQAQEQQLDLKQVNKCNNH